jgi:hypothetical protein
MILFVLLFLELAFANDGRRLCSSSISLTGSQRVIAFIFKLYRFDSHQI